MSRPRIIQPGQSYTFSKYPQPVLSATLRTPLATSRGTRRQSPQVGKAAQGAVSPTQWLLCVRQIHILNQQRPANFTADIG